MDCGHCVAICPTGAVSISDYPPQPLYDYDPKLMNIDPTNLLRFIQFRRSCRRFQDRPVEKEKLDMMVQAGRFTATGGNLQDVSYVIVQEQLQTLRPMVWEGLHSITEPAARGELADVDPTAVNYADLWRRCYEKYQRDPNNPNNDVIFFNAPAIIIVKSELAHHAQLAASNVELMAYAQGLACLYTGFLRRGIVYGEQAREFLHITGKENMLCMLVGYPVQKYRRTVPRKEANALWL